MKRIIAGALCVLTTAGTYASDFFSTDECPNMFTFGARVGVNTSNRTLGAKAIEDAYHYESWGTGIDLGITVDINLRDYISIQPGFFYESRSGHYTLMGVSPDEGYAGQFSEIAQTGKRTSHNFTIPVMAAFHFNVTDNLRWNVEAGPYVSFVFSSRLKNKRFVVNGTADTPLFSQKPAPFDFGVKMGTGLEILGHYCISAHYMAGCIDAWKSSTVGNLTKSYGGVTKAWVFSLGYKF